MHFCVLLKLPIFFVVGLLTEKFLLEFYALVRRLVDVQGETHTIEHYGICESVYNHHILLRESWARSAISLSKS